MPTDVATESFPKKHDVGHSSRLNRMAPPFEQIPSERVIGVLDALISFYPHDWRTFHWQDRNLRELARIVLWWSMMRTCRCKVFEDFWRWRKKKVEGMTKKRIRWLTLVLILVGLLLVSMTLAPRVVSSEVGWRLAVLSEKVQGNLPEIPFRDLVGWLAPGSPVYLQGLSESSTPGMAIQNGFTGPEDVEKGRATYSKTCEQCHDVAGRGHAGPSLIEAVTTSTDWSFFSTVKWGRAGTSMSAQPIDDQQIWQIHAYLRHEAWGIQGQRAASGRMRPAVDLPPEEIVNSDANPAEWRTYAGDYFGHRHSSLAQVTKSSVRDLQLAWVAQLRQVDMPIQASPIVVDGVMFVTESREGVVALDAQTGDVIWTYRREVPDNLSLCCGAPNRGVAVLGSTVFVATIDSFLVAIDANTGKQRWITKVADYRDGFTMTGAPLALNDRIVVGVAGGEYGIRGFVAAYGAADGKLLWKFNTVPEPGEPGHDTWGGDSWKTAGAPTWTTGSYDPALEIVYWGTGNPSPDFDASVRAGDNLYSNCVVALDAATGQLRWYYQFSPHDDHDWDSNQQPMLAEIQWQGRPRSVLLWANRNAFFYALDRTNGEFLYAKPFVKQTWNEGFDDKGRPQVASSARPTVSGSLVWPAIMSATNWWPPSYDPTRQLAFVPTSDAAGIYFLAEEAEYERGERFDAGTTIKYAQNQPATAYVKAIDVLTGDVRWQTVLASGPDDFMWTVGGILSLNSGVVFSGYRDVLRAFDADTGDELWQVNLGGRVRGSPVSYAMDNRQYIAIGAGHSIFVFTAGVSSNRSEVKP